MLDDWSITIQIYIPEELSLDRWEWKENEDKYFTVKSAYDFLISRSVLLTFSDKSSKAYRYLSKTKLPSKIQIFIWRVILNRLPTPNALIRRGVITNPHDHYCVFCFS